MNIEIISWFASAYDFYLFTSKRTSHEVICMSVNMTVEIPNI